MTDDELTLLAMVSRNLASPEVLEMLRDLAKDLDARWDKIMRAAEALSRED